MNKQYIISLLIVSIASISCFSQQNILTRANLKHYSFELLDCSPNSMPYLDSVVQEYNHYFVAEYHRLSSAIHLQKKMISYLVRHRQLNKVVVERSHSFGFWINKYLHSGDTTLLRAITNNCTDWDLIEHGKDDTKVDFFHFYYWLYSLSKSTNTAIEVVGIDVEFTNLATELWSLNKLFVEYNLQNILTNSYEILRSWERKEKLSASKMKKWLKVFNKEKEQYRNQVKQKMGEDYQHIAYISENLSNALPEFKINRKAGYRDSIMYKNYMKHVMPTDVAYSQFGHGHTTLKYGSRTPRLQGRSFASHVENNPKYKGKSLSFNLICNKCYSRYSYLLTEEQHAKMAKLTDYQSAMFDFREAKAELADFPEYFPYVIFIYD